MDVRIQAPVDQKPDPTKVPDNVTLTSSGEVGSKETVRVTADLKPEEKKGEERQQWLPEKFKSPDDLKTALVELAKKNGASEAQVKLYSKMDADADLAAVYSEMERTQSKGTEKKETEEKPKPETATPDQAKDALTKAGLSMSDFDTEFNRDGKLSDDSYGKLEKAGFDRATVDKYIDGQKAIAEKNLNEVLSITGGTPDSYDLMVKWAAANLPKEDVAGFDKIMMTGDHYAVLNAVRGLFSRYQQAEGIDPKLVGGGTDPAKNAGDVFRSAAEVVAAVRDPRYKTDPAYRAAYDKKLARSDVF